MNAIAQTSATTHAAEFAGINIQSIMQSLTSEGVVIVHTEQFDIADFSQLIHQLCDTLTFDPAREYASDAAQTVNAGTAAVGLHIENGNTPLPPDIVSFFSKRSASHGAQTTYCDGAKVYQALPATLRARFEQPFTMTRNLPKIIWQRYVATAFGMEDPADVGIDLLNRFIAAVPGQSYQPAAEGSIDYCLTIDGIRSDNLAGLPAFANALLGPSYNYQAPVYRFADGSLIDDATLSHLRELGERFTHEINWCDGDIAIIDNKRVMHGRRAITVPLTERELYIAMGSGAKQPR